MRQLAAENMPQHFKVNKHIVLPMAEEHAPQDHACMSNVDP